MVIQPVVFELSLKERREIIFHNTKIQMTLVPGTIGRCQSRFIPLAIFAYALG